MCKHQKNRKRKKLLSNFQKENSPNKVITTIKKKLSTELDFQSEINEINILKFLEDIVITPNNKQKLQELVAKHYQNIPIKKIIQKNLLSELKILLILDAIFNIDPIFIADTHTYMFTLYAKYHQTHKIKHLIQKSENLDLDEATLICKEYDLKDELVLLSKKLGNPRMILGSHVENDFKTSLNLLEAHKSDPYDFEEYWNIFFEKYRNDHEKLAILLSYIDHHPNPYACFSKFKTRELKSPLLWEKLLKILQVIKENKRINDYAKKIFSAEKWKIVERTTRKCQKGFLTDNESICEICGLQVIKVKNKERKQDVTQIMFPSCRHNYHPDCLQNILGSQEIIFCKSCFDIQMDKSSSIYTSTISSARSFTMQQCFFWIFNDFDKIFKLIYIDTVCRNGPQFHLRFSIQSKNDQYLGESCNVQRTQFQYTNPEKFPPYKMKFFKSRKKFSQILQNKYFCAVNNISYLQDNKYLYTNGLTCMNQQ